MSFSSSIILGKPIERPTIIVTTNYDLINCVKQEIDKYGYDADLNHIDVSQITNFSNVFAYSDFIGDISKWNVSNGETFTNMFAHSKFNGNLLMWDMSSAIYLNSMFFHSEFNNDISLWDTHNVKSMHSMFEGSKFNKDINLWNIDNVIDMSGMFSCSEFKQSLENWNPQYCNCEYMFTNISIPEKHWYKKKQSEYRKELKRMIELEWSEDNHAEITLDKVKQLEPGEYCIYLNRDTGKILSKNDWHVATIRLMKFNVRENMSEKEWLDLFYKIKHTEKTCLNCAYKTTLCNLYPREFIAKMKPWKQRKNTHSNGNEYVSLYLIASINWHAKLARLPLIKKDGNGFNFIYTKPNNS